MIDPIKITGWMLPSELSWLEDQASKHFHIIEIGIWKGRSTSAICRGISSHDFGKLIAIDDWSGSLIDPINFRELIDNREAVIAECRANLQEFIEDRIIKIIEMSSNDAYIILNASGYKADMIFIDGDHEASQVANDCRNYRNLLIPGGLICGHDIHLPQVRAAVVEYIGKDYMTSDTIWWKRL